MSLFISLLLTIACNNNSDDLEGRISELENRMAEVSSFKLGLGQTMNQIQIYHTKFYFAMKNDNRDLMKYINHELEENFEDVVENHAFHDGVNIEELAQNTILPALEELEEKVNNSNIESVNQAFDYLTLNCNKCHSASGHTFIRINYPESNSYLNQDFRNFTK